VAGATARAAKEIFQARADARAVPEGAGPAKARAKKTRTDKPGN